MPPSSDQENHPTSIISTLAKAQAEKAATPGVYIPSKKERRNGAAKDGGGGKTAMTKLPKMLNSNKPASPSIPVDVQPQEIKAEPTRSLGSTTNSPLLGALPTNGLPTSTVQNTTEWAKNVPVFSGSPGNLINLSDSPPTQPSSYDDKSMLAVWPHRDRAIPNGHFASASPPVYRRRPVSFHLDGQQGVEDYPAQRILSTFRRSSMYSQQSQRFSPHPPLPHQAQPHFYGAPDINLGTPSRSSGSVPGSQGYYCGFDSLYTSGCSASKQVENVVISGYEGGLDICRVSKNGLEMITNVENLRGGVFNAKILPWSVKIEDQSNSQLIALVVHGPVWHSSDASPGLASDGGNLQPDGAPVLRTDSPRGSPHGFLGPPSEKNIADITHYQTTVEVYSLTTKTHVKTLLSLPKTLLRTPIRSPLFISPPPIGDLSITADAGNIVITSGTTGEAWIYHQTTSENDGDMVIRCSGKIWTALQRSPVQDPLNPDLAEAEPMFGETRPSYQNTKTALVSLRGRWLAFSPSTSTSQVSLRAVVPDVSSTTRVYGLNTYAPPQVPSVNCTVDTPGGDEFWGRMRRQAAQTAFDVLKGIGGVGRGLWNNWTSSSNPTSNSTSPNSRYGLHHMQHDPSFPPTHGEGLQQVPNPESTLISILDLKKLGSFRGNSSTTSPIIATFKAPLGCSFLSFAPSGLALLTASSKGDVQIVWDLMRMQHSKSSSLHAQNPAITQGQHVRQMAIFTRLTVAKIVDVLWTLPHGDRIALVTERNTVHFLELPAASFAWPPPRRRVQVASPSSPPAGDEIETPNTAASMASSAVNAAWNLRKMAQPLMTRPRGFSGSNTPSNMTATMVASAGQGGKALAGGISKSFGAATGAIQHFYQSGENKLHLPQSSTLTKMGCFRWLGGTRKEQFAALVDGVIKIYTIRQIKVRGKEDRQRMHVGSRSLDFRIPLVPDYTIAPAALRAMDLEDEIEISEETEGTQWIPNHTSAVKADVLSGAESSIPQAEIESNAPYQPFHTDRRVGLCIYSSIATVQSTSPSVSTLLPPISIKAQPLAADAADAPWVFGQPILTMKLNVGPSQVDEDEFDSAEDHRALPTSAMERVTMRIAEADEEVEQIVITTRRRKSPRGPTDIGEDDEGFFEDDCEVLDFASQRV